MIRAIVFDLDGTLVDSTADIRTAMNRAFATLGLPPVTDEVVEPALGEGALALVRACVRAVDPRSADDEFVEGAKDRYIEAYAADPAPHTRLHSDAADTLRALYDAGLALGICTNKDTGLSRMVLAATGLDAFIGVVKGRDSTEHPKPDPRHLLETIDDLGAEPGEVIYVGDNPVDVALAGSAGVAYRHVAWGVPVRDDVIELKQFSDLLNMTKYSQ